MAESHVVEAIEDEYAEATGRVLNLSWQG